MKYIKLFENFLNENKIEYTTIILSSSEVEQFIIDKLEQNSNYFDNAIYRNINLNEDYIKVDNTNFIRKSTFGYNYLNLVLSNDIEFVDFQKRNKSIICTTDKEFAKFFNIKGSVYLVIPLVINPIFTFIKYEDFNEAFCETTEMLTSILDEIFKITNIKINDTNYTIFKNQIKEEIDKKCEFDNEFKENIINNVKINIFNNDYNNFFKLIYDIFDLEEFKSEFNNINFLDIHTIKNNSYEIWTESTCILLNVESELVKKYNLIKI